MLGKNLRGAASVLNSKNHDNYSKIDQKTEKETQTVHRPTNRHSEWRPGRKTDRQSDGPSEKPTVKQTNARSIREKKSIPDHGQVTYADHVTSPIRINWRHLCRSCDVTYADHVTSPIRINWRHLCGSCDVTYAEHVTSLMTLQMQTRSAAWWSSYPLTSRLL